MYKGQNCRGGTVSAIIKNLPKKIVEENFKILKKKKKILRRLFVAKLVREAYESHVDCGLHEGSDQKY